jgi:hypothetical protein
MMGATVGELILAAIILLPIIFGPLVVAGLALAMAFRGSLGVIKQLFKRREK